MTDTQQIEYRSVHPQAFPKWQDDLTPKNIRQYQIDAIRDYQNMYYGSINFHHRFGYNNPHTAITFISDTMDAMLESAPLLSRPVVLYRGVRGPAWRDVAPGYIWQEPSFLTATINKSITERFAVGSFKDGYLAELRVPSGIKAIAAQTSEYEIILPRNTTWQVVDKDNLSVTMELMIDG